MPGFLGLKAEFFSPRSRPLSSLPHSAPLSLNASGSSYISVATKFNANDYCASSDYCYNCNWGCGCHSKLIYNNGGNSQYLIRAKRSAFSSTQIPSGKVLSSAYGTFRLGYNYYSRTICTTPQHQPSVLLPALPTT